MIFTNKILYFLVFIITIYFKANIAFAIENKIILKIDNKIVTSLDIKNEQTYLTALNPNIKNLSQKEIYELSKNSLIREKIKKKELLKAFNELEVEENIIDQVIKNLYSDINITSINDFKNFLEQKDLNFENVKEKIKIEILWNRLVYIKYNSKVKINATEIKNEVQNKKEKMKKFFLQEILFEVKENEKLIDKHQLILDNIKNKGFENTALIFSISDTSKKNGNIGWVNENSLNNLILSEIKKIKVNEFTKPITIPGGFLILKLKDVERLDSEINLDEEVNKIIRAKTNQQLNQYSAIFYNKIKKDIKINEI